MDLIAYIDDIDEEYQVIYRNTIYRRQHGTSAVQLFSVVLTTPLLCLRSSTTVSYGSCVVLNLYYHYKCQYQCVFVPPTSTCLVVWLCVLFY